MSRLFAEYLMNTKDINKDEIAEVFQQTIIEARYFRHTKMFEFKVLDFYGYVSDPSVPFFYNVKIEEADLLRMITIDNYSEDEKNELYYHKMLTEVEQQNLDDNVFWDLSILQYFFHISKQTLVEIKRQQHLYKLYRTKNPKYELKVRQLHSNGGRPLNSLTQMTDTDLQNIENAEVIIENCVAHDWYYEFMDLYRVLIRFKKTELTLTGAKWKFYILRYKYKLEQGFKDRNEQYEKELIIRNNKYKIFDNLSF